MLASNFYSQDLEEGITAQLLSLSKALETLLKTRASFVIYCGNDELFKQGMIQKVLTVWLIHVYNQRRMFSGWARIISTTNFL